MKGDSLAKVTYQMNIRIVHGTARDGDIDARFGAIENAARVAHQRRRPVALQQCRRHVAVSFHKEMTMSQDTKYIPALRFKFLTPLYDPLLRWGMREETFKPRLIQDARIAPNARVLDLGCGTGTLTILVKQSQPTAEVIGFDGDTQVLDIAREKARAQDVLITFEQGMAYQLPYLNESFDRVLSSLVLHHLTTPDRERALRQVYRVLKSNGEFWIIDFGKPHNALAFLVSRVMRNLERTEDLIDGLLPEQLQRAGFQEVQVVRRFMTLFGTITLYTGRKGN